MSRVLDSFSAALAAGGRAVTAPDEIGELGRSAVRLLAGELGGATVIWLLDEAGDLLDALASADPDQVADGLLARALGKARPSAVLGLLGRIISTGAPIEAYEATWSQLGEWGDADALGVLEASGPMAFRLVPVRARSRTLGALLLARPASDTGGSPSTGEMTLLQDVADQIGLAVANDRLSRSALAHLSSRRDSEEALRSSETRIRGIARSAPVLLFACDREGILTLLDGGLLAEFEVLPSVFVGRSLFTAYEDYPEFLEIARRALDGEQLRRVPVQIEGHDLEAWAVPLRTSRGEPDGAAGIVVDVSARVAAERLLVDAARRETALVEHASDVILVMARDGALRYANPAAVRMLGETRQGGGEIDVISLVHADDRDRVRRYFAEAAQKPGSAPSIEFRIAHADGSWRTVEAIGDNMIDDPAVNGFVVTLRDVTARRDSEERLRSNAGRQAASRGPGTVGARGPRLPEPRRGRGQFARRTAGSGLRARVRGDARQRLCHLDRQSRPRSFRAGAPLDRPDVLAGQLCSRHPGDGDLRRLGP